VFGFANGNLPLAIFVSALLASQRPYDKAVPAALLLAAAAFVIASGESLIYLQPSTALAAAIVLAQCVLAIVALWQTPLRQGTLVLCIALAVPALLGGDDTWGHASALIYIAAAIALFGPAPSTANLRDGSRHPRQEDRMTDTAEGRSSVFTGVRIAALVALLPSRSSSHPH
jgi:hypothetical protein